MCVTVGPAKLAKTVIYIGEVEHAEYGLVHVLGYQNKPASLAGPNAMLLHFPAADPLGPKSVIDVGDYPEFLTDLQKYMAPRPPATRGGMLRSAAPKVIQIFDVGIYTVVMANKASYIPDALELVDTNKRPALNPALFDWYERQMPGYQLAVCCFDNADKAKTAAPLFWWYKPLKEDVLMAPGLDAHDGGVPDRVKPVSVDAAMIVGSFRSHEEIGASMMTRMPKAFAPYAPKRLRATEFEGNYENADYVIPVPGLADRISTKILVRRSFLDM